MKPLGAEETELLKHLAYQSRLCQLADRKCLGIYEKPMLQFLATKSLSQRQAIFCCADQGVVLRVMELLVAMPAGGYQSMTHKMFISGNFAPVRPAKVKRLLADTLLVGKDWCLTLEEKQFLEHCVVVVDPGGGKRAIAMNVNYLMDLPKLFELFKAISCGQAFTKIPDAERRIAWADEAPILSLGQKLVAVFELCVWEAWQTYRQKPQGPPVVVKSFESLDLVAPTMQALERVVAHQHKRRASWRDFLSARNVQAMREFSDDAQKLTLLASISRRRYHKRPDILLPTFSKDVIVLSALERLMNASQPRSGIRTARARRYLTAVQVAFHDLCCVPLLQTFTFMQEYRGILRNTVMLFAADLAAQALVVSLDAQLSTNADKSSSKKQKKKQRSVKQDKDETNADSHREPDSVATLAPTTTLTSPSNLQSWRLVIPLRPSEVSEREVTHTQLRVMINQLVHEVIDTAVQISDAKAPKLKSVNTVSPTPRPVKVATKQQHSPPPPNPIDRSNLTGGKPKSLRLHLNDAEQFPPLRRQPPVLSAQDEEKTAGLHTTPPVRLKTQVFPDQLPATPVEDSSMSHITGSPTVRSMMPSTLDHTSIPLNLGAFSVPAYFWGDWLHQEPAYTGRPHEVSGTPPPPVMVELTHTLLSSGSEARSKALRLYPDIQPLDDQARLPLSLAQDIYGRFSLASHFEDQGAHDSEAADVDDTNSASAQAASVAATEDQGFEAGGEVVDVPSFQLEDPRVTRPQAASRPSTATTRQSNLAISKEHSFDTNEQRFSGSADTIGRMTRSRSSSGARTSSAALGLTPRAEESDSTSEHEGRVSFDSAMSNGPTRQTRASSKPEIVLSPPDLELSPLPERKRAESAEHVGRIHRRDRSNNSEGVVLNRGVDPPVFQRQASPPLRRPSSLHRPHVDDQDISVQSQGFGRFRRSHSETRVSGHAHTLGKTADPHSEASSGVSQQERSPNDQNNSDIPDARTVLAVLTGACLRSQAEVAVLVNLLAVQRTIISAMQLDVAGSLTALAEQQARLQQPSQALEVMSDEGNTQFTSRRRPLVFHQRVGAAAPATTTLHQSLQLSPAHHRASQSDLQGQNGGLFATSDDQLMGATLLTHRTHEASSAVEEPVAVLSPRRQSSWMPRSRPPTPPYSGPKHRASIDYSSREPFVSGSAPRGTGRSKIRGPRKSEGALSLRLGAQFDSFPVADPTPNRPYIDHSARYADHDARTSSDTIPMNPEPELDAHPMPTPNMHLPARDPRVWTGFSPRSRLQNNGLCYSILTREIIDFVTRIDEIEERRRAAKSVALAKARSAVQSLWPRAQVKAYGSYVTGLSLPSSDLDMVICLPQVFKDSMAEAPGALEGRNAIKETWQQNLARYLRSEDWVDMSSIKVIAHAAIPVMKFNTLPDEKRQLPSVSLDVSFEGGDHHGLAANGLILSLLRQYPAARALVLVLKHCLATKGLCEAYTGGLSSYALFLMVARFLQEQHCELDIGAMLLGALNFYGDHFDPRTTGISVARRCYFGRQYSMLTAGSKAPNYFASLDRRHNSGGVDNRTDNSRQQDAAGLTVPFQFDPLFIEDPLTPGNNVGRNCFRVFQVQKIWSDLHTIICEDIRRTEEEGIARPLLSRLVGQYKDML